ncbi:hypothetical protein BX600DRAFT_228984 [Xylariales sp. PMI_506]|nr:hypothetical protein BX600DRAFT_228984 [Xylariales sp. PMI_506]
MLVVVRLLMLRDILPDYSNTIPQCFISSDRAPVFLIPSANFSRALDRPNFMVRGGFGDIHIDLQWLSYSASAAGCSVMISSARFKSAEMHRPPHWTQLHGMKMPMCSYLRSFWEPARFSFYSNLRWMMSIGQIQPVFLSHGEGGLKCCREVGWRMLPLVLVVQNNVSCDQLHRGSTRSRCLPLLYHPAPQMVL